MQKWLFLVGRTVSLPEGSRYRERNMVLQSDSPVKADSPVIPEKSLNLSIFLFLGHKIKGVDVHWVSPVAQTVKNPPAMWKTRVRSLGQEDPLKKGMATHSSILAWRIPMDRGAWWATVHGVSKSQTRLSNYHFH